MSYQVNLKPIDDDSNPKSSTGTMAWAPKNTDIPKCKECGKDLLLFLQIELREELELPFLSGSQLIVCMCPECNEIPSFEEFKEGKLDETFWEKNEGHFYVALFSPGEELVIHKNEKLLRSFEMEFLPSEDIGSHSDHIRVGGDPFWLQEPEVNTCSCGGEMKLICQIPENFPFSKLSTSPEQPDSFSSDDYCLFLGNETYIFGCTSQCDRQAVKVVVQG
ncbi:hypothetical protein [Zooshikella harenae]|uniref:DUF1963 domain-containing protein n=1 Tax=Zooshikella harenae TaxID=2827238 RepID=A0ABS5ZFS5_9GAMM|nr:hypothetical protein [Zooshikella harenae]MBU2712859.1 hypothetical protein [Zooshikella harenae]